MNIMFLKKIFIFLLIFILIILLIKNKKEEKVPIINILIDIKITDNIDNINNYETLLNNYLKNYNVSVLYYNINNQYTYKYKENQIYYGASLIKVLDALYVYENLELTEEIKKLVRLAIKRSDNLAHQKLVQIIGFDNLKHYGQLLGATKVLTNGSTDIYGLATVNDEFIYLKYLYNYLIQNDNSRTKELKSFFINSYYNYLSFDDCPVILHKYGYYGSFYHDMGIVLAREPYIIIVLTKESPNFSLVTDISQKIYEFHQIVNKKNYSLS